MRERLAAVVQMCRPNTRFWAVAVRLLKTNAEDGVSGTSLAHANDDIPGAELTSRYF